MQQHPSTFTAPAIRMARHADLPELVAMIHALAQHHGDTATATEAALRRDLFGPTRLLDVFVAERDGRLVGYLAAARFYRAQFARRCVEVHHLYVEPDDRGGGIGRGLVEACLRYATALGCEEAMVGTAMNNDAAQGFYGAIGFAAAGGGARFARPIG